MSSVVVEIRAAEGGADAKRLVLEQFGIYARYCGATGCAVSVLEERPGLLVFEATGPGVAHLFAGEPGGHRWQRVPPTEKRGRRHTSTVTVAVLPVEEERVRLLSLREIEWQATRGSGPGGQHRNKTSTAVQMRHVPSGLTVRIETERSQEQNRRLALRVLAARLAAAERDEQQARVARSRREQVGTGQRGDKIRTVRTQDDTVTDHRTGKRTSYARYRDGNVQDVSP